MAIAPLINLYSEVEEKQSVSDSDTVSVEVKDHCRDLAPDDSQAATESRLNRPTRHPMYFRGAPDILTRASSKRTPVNPIVKQNPPIDEPVMVTYEQFECLGYLDDKGAWREWFSNRELRNIIDWTALD